MLTLKNRGVSSPWAAKGDLPMNRVLLGILISVLCSDPSFADRPCYGLYQEYGGSVTDDPPLLSETACDMMKSDKKVRLGLDDVVGDEDPSFRLSFSPKLSTSSIGGTLWLKWKF